MPSALPIGPAMKPAHVLFGLTFGANFLWPNAIPPSMEKLSPMNATTNGISTNAGPILRSSAMQPYIAGNKNAATMQTGVVDGAEQPIANYKSNAFPEVANNLILDGHTLGAVQAVITDNAWGKLTENQQAAIMEAGADTQAFNADLSETAENKVLEELRSSGCNVVDVDD